MNHDDANYIATEIKTPLPIDCQRDTYTTIL